MDQRLQKRLEAIDRQIGRLATAEEAFLSLEASEEGMYAVLYLKTKGTVAEREAMVHASTEWDQFTKGLVRAKVDYLTAKRKLDLITKTFDAEYLSYKIEGSAIVRQGAVT